MAVKKIEFPTEAIILAGGLGTRLGNIVKDLPKPMALINGRPFLEYLINNLIQQGIDHFILSVGHKHEAIIDHFGNIFNHARITYVIEHEALGTGGAVKYASQYAKGDNFWIFNGDTYVDIDLKDFVTKVANTELALSLIAMTDFDRFGIVQTDETKITAFKEKEFTKKGFINAGIYLISRAFIDNHFPDQKIFSFEKDVLEKKISEVDVGFYKTSSQFIDIGIPEDYFRAQFRFTNNADVKSIFLYDDSWTIFLDRDGVINQRIPDSYIKNNDEFIFLPGAKEAIKKLSDTFKRIIIITNQQGIAKGKISQVEADNINDFMLAEIQRSGGRIDRLYMCPMLASKKPNCRKPNPDMALMAKIDFPEIDFHKSIMIGDSVSDMQFGKKLGMKNILIPTKEEEMIQYCELSVDWRIRGMSDLI